MSRGFVKLAENEYVEWSTVVDAPVSYVLTREEAVKLADPDGEERIARADRNGTSFRDVTSNAAEYVAYNRAGMGEACITLDEIRERYRRPPKED